MRACVTGCVRCLEAAYLTEQSERSHKLGWPTSSSANVPAQPSQAVFPVKAKGTLSKCACLQQSVARFCLQRTLEIWTFAIQFAWRYILINKKWSYKNKEMTPVSALYVCGQGRVYECLLCV
jgi:hypothetical protein